MRKNNLFKHTFWKSASIVIVLFGVYSLISRFVYGLGRTTNLSDMVPWGLWIGFDFIGVGLAAAGFTIAATAHIFNEHKYHSIVRPAILTAYIGYIIVIALLIIDLGKPENFWHPLVMWNIHSVMFEITWCVICYSTVLTLEFAPVILEKFKLKAPLKLLRKISIPVVVCGVLFSTLHQSSFGSLYLIAPAKVYPLWYSSYLPVHFFISCIAAGLSMIIFEAYLCARALNQGLQVWVLSGLGKLILAVLSIELVFKFSDLIISGKFSYLFMNLEETYLFWLEIFVGFIVPITILLIPGYLNNRKWLYFASIFTISGFVLNRLNVSISSLVRTSGLSYAPTFYEISITLMLVVLGMIAFRLVTENFAVFEKRIEIENPVQVTPGPEQKELIFGK
ncbi:MAG TPA: NrfD/PsrC family molybdoenzyme membrane anchor subunit [Ignavibacteriaceae bacterium]|nr:NrfD/PsrC family molybdoenzyme membrane anchor subunit [Ignavibacteriaceae bacterium]